MEHNANATTCQWGNRRGVSKWLLDAILNDTINRLGGGHETREMLFPKGGRGGTKGTRQPKNHPDTQEMEGGRRRQEGPPTPRERNTSPSPGRPQTGEANSLAPA